MTGGDDKLGLVVGRPRGWVRGQKGPGKMKQREQGAIHGANTTW